MNLSTTYLGLKLRTPLVPSASPLSQHIDQLKKMEDAGASAVVLHSLFEEQIRARNTRPEHALLPSAEGGRAARAFANVVVERLPAPEEYLDHISLAKRTLQIPVIASLNGTSFGGWTTYSRLIEQAGADALELNFYSIPTELDRSAEDIENEYVTLLATIRNQVEFPIAVKLSPYFTNIGHFGRRLEKQGANGLVLFNRFLQPDINLDTEEVVPQVQLSTSSALRLPLRWTALLYRRLQVSLAGSGGVHRGSDVIKLIMAGADVAMLCSVLLRNGIDYLRLIEHEIVSWLDRHEKDSLAAIKGKLSQAHCPDPSAYERAQYVRAVGCFPHASGE